MLDLLLEWLIRLLEQGEDRAQPADLNAKVATFYRLASSDRIGALSSDEQDKLRSGLAELRPFIDSPPPSLSAESQALLTTAFERLVELVRQQSPNRDVAIEVGE